jgi:alkaline phosphatase
VVNDRAALLAAPEGAERLLGLFDTDHLPYRLDHRGEAELGARIPSLAEMTTAALSRLARRRDGFVLQVEGGRVDHAAHNNDSASLILEMLDFDEAVAIALSFQQQNPDTLVVVTTDHGNSNPGLTGVGQNDTALARLDGFRVSTERLAAGLGSTASLEELRKRLVAATGLPLTDDELAPLHAALAGHGNAPYRPDRAFAPTLASVLENHTAIGWTGVDHTADFVLFSAIGPGAAGFPTLIRNDAVHSHLVEALSLHSVRAGA